MIELNSRGRTIKSVKPLVMGVLNCTEDSFYEASRTSQYPAVCKRIDELISAGVDIIDIGGKSTKPGSMDIAAAVELERISAAMQDHPQYDNVTEDLVSFFREKIVACQIAGIKQLILDPGFGFGKTLEHNYLLVSQLEKFVALGHPVLAGFSRKSMIYKLLQITPDEALNGTTVLNTVALMKGASMLRVHDAREAVETVKIIEQIKKA